MLASKILRVIGRVVASSLTAVALLGSTVGCYSMRTSTAQLKVGESGRLEFPQGLAIPTLAHPEDKDSIVMRTVTAIEGTIVGSTADSFRLSVQRTFPTVPRASHQILVVPRSATINVQHRELSAPRTALLLIGIGAVTMGFLYLMAVGMEFGPAKTKGGGY